MAWRVALPSRYFDLNGERRKVMAHRITTEHAASSIGSTRFPGSTPDAVAMSVCVPPPGSYRRMRPRRASACPVAAGCSSACSRWKSTLALPLLRPASHLLCAVDAVHPGELRWTGVAAICWHRLQAAVPASVRNSRIAGLHGPDTGTDPWAYTLISLKRDITVSCFR
jgi:hypothetical protein